MMEFNDFRKLHERAFTDELVGLPIVYDNLNDVFNGIQQSRYFLLGGLTGTGKTAFVDDMFVISLFDWWWNENKCSEKDFKISWIYNSMERNKTLKMAKWIALKLYNDTGDLISPDTLIGATKKNKSEKLIDENRLMLFHKDRIESYSEYIAELNKHLRIYSGAATPTTIMKRFTNFAKKHGKLIEGDEGEEIYIPNHPNHTIIGVNDHIGKVKKEKGMGDKETLDLHSANMGICRDVYLMNPVDITQFNRNIADVSRKRNDDVYPRLDDFKGTADTTENADYVIALFNPVRFNLPKYSDYSLDFFTGIYNEDRFTGISVLKNSYGVSDVDFGFGFLGEVGKFYPLRSAQKINVVPKYQKEIKKLLRLKD